MQVLTEADKVAMLSSQEELLELMQQQPSGEVRRALQIMEMPRKGSLRNQPCPCGSGRKFKKCCWGLS